MSNIKINNITNKELYRKVIDTKLFTEHSLDGTSYSFTLNDTDFILIIRGDYLMWQKEFIKKEPYLSFHYANCDFESVFNKVPNHIKKKLLYNIDLFTK